MSISKKKRDQLYSLVSDEVMNSRIEIARVLGKECNSEIGKKIDEILYQLSINAPYKAIKLFDKQPVVLKT